MARTRVIAIAASLVALAAAGCGAAQPSAQPAATPAQVENVSGILDRGLSATCPADEPCDPPPRATALVFSTAGGSQVRAEVDYRGQFEVHLDPGVYSITTVPPPFGGRVVPSSVQVPETGSVFLQLHIAKPS
jgi:hypothetical protein